MMKSLLLLLAVPWIWAFQASPPLAFRRPGSVVEVEGRKETNNLYAFGIFKNTGGGSNSGDTAKIPSSPADR